MGQAQTCSWDWMQNELKNTIIATNRARQYKLILKFSLYCFDTLRHIDIDLLHDTLQRVYN